MSCRWLNGCAVAAAMVGGIAAGFGQAGAGSQAATQPVNVTISAKAVKGGGAVADVQIDVNAGGHTKVITGADGGAAVTLPGANFSSLSLVVRKEGWVPMVWRWSRSVKEQSPPSHIDVVMEKSAEAGGYVVDGKGNRLPGATVLVVLQKTYGDRHQGLYNTEDAVTADGDGKWVYRDGPAVVDGVQIGASHPLCLGAYGFYELKPFEDLDGFGRGTAQVVLQRSPGILELSVTDQAGKAVPGAKVGYGADRVASNALDEMAVDEAGHLTLGVPVGVQAVVTVKAQGFAPDMWTGAGPLNPTEVAVVLKPAKALTGRVVDPSGKPVAGAAVFFDTWRGMRTLVEQVKTGADGTFSWEGAPADTVTAAVQAPGLLRQNRVELTAGQENVVTLKKSTVLRGKVLDDASGEAIRNYRVVWGIARANTAVIWQRSQPAPKVKEDGTFETTFSGFYDGMEVKIEAPGYEPAVGDRVDTTAGNVVEQVYRLKKGKNIEGTVVTAKGDPALGVKVWVATPSDEVRMEGTQVAETRDLVSATTDGRGHFVMDPQGDAFGLYITADDGYAAVGREELEKSGGKVTLTPWGRIEGTVKRGGVGAASVKVRIIYLNAAPLAVTGGGRVAMSLMAETDAAGKYLVDRAFAGTVQAGVVAEQVMAGEKSAVVAVKGGETAKVDVGQ